jgi:hypothetical protein
MAVSAHLAGQKVAKLRGRLVSLTLRLALQTILLCIHFKIKVLGSECQTSGTNAMRAKQATKKDNAAACWCFLNYLAFFRPAADRAVPILPWLVSRGRSYGFLWAASIFQSSHRSELS